MFGTIRDSGQWTYCAVLTVVLNSCEAVDTSESVHMRSGINIAYILVRLVAFRDVVTTPLIIPRGPGIRGVR
jgi:hypothetical protein